MLKPIQQESLADIVEKNLYDFLKEKKFSPGDSFPGENNLSQMLQISRPVVREALSRMRMLGVLESKKGRGLIVGKPAIFVIFQKMIDLAFLSEKEKRDFILLRLTIEIGIADLLVLNITAKDIDLLEEIVSEEEEEPGNFELYTKCDYKFHSQLYKSCRSDALISFQTVLFHFFFDSTTPEKYISPDFATRFENPGRSTHRDILEAIKTRDVENIQKEMRRHLKIHFEHLQETKPQSEDTIPYSS